MSFDKVKAMRNAERFLAQGKIRAAISEYKRIAESDPKDFSTLNMLGDLHAKANDTTEAVKCFNQVAEHYSKQGFFQKAIAIYNKILRHNPQSWEVSAKLAELYQQKGLSAEARSHYTIVADYYQKKGKNEEALAVWKQIAELDPNNTEIYLKIADFCAKAEQTDEAAEAYVEAGNRLYNKNQYEQAASAFSRALEFKPDDLLALKGFVNAQIKLGFADEAAQTLEGILEKQPYNREVIYLLVDCYLDIDNPEAAERTVIKLVEKEPTSYPKFLDLVSVYLKKSDLNSAARVLAMSAEHLLVGGQAKELEKWTEEILSRNPEHLDALRLLIRLHGWQRDEQQLKSALERLAEAARTAEAVEEERYALSQLIMIAPHESAPAQRLQELNALYGAPEVAYESPIIPNGFPSEVPAFETFAVLGDESKSDYSAPPGTDVSDYGEYAAELSYAGNGASDDEIYRKNGSSNGSNGFRFDDEGAMPPVENLIEISGNDFTPQTGTELSSDQKPLSPFQENHLRQELESVEFYVAQGYRDLAEKSLETLEEEFGKRPETEALRAALKAAEPVDLTGDAAVSAAKDDAPVTFAEETPVAFAEEPAVSFIEESPVVFAEESAAEVESAPSNAFEISGESSVLMPQAEADDRGFDILSEFREELGLEDAGGGTAEGDYETHYHLGIAYKEMGLMEDAIRELQDAMKFVSADDGTRRFLLCCILLGHCFMEKQMPNLGLMWFKRGLEAANITSEERQGLNYEIANAYEAGGDREKAREFFGQIYAVNVDFRDVGERLRMLEAALVE